MSALRVRPWLLVAFVVACFFGFSSQAWAAFVGPHAEGVWSVPVGESGSWVECDPAATGPNNGMCVVGSYDYAQDPPFSQEKWCGGKCWSWSAADGPMDPLPDADPAAPPEGLTAADVVKLCWTVIYCWCAVWGIRQLAWAARPTGD